VPVRAHALARRLPVRARALASEVPVRARALARDAVSQIKTTQQRLAAVPEAMTQTRSLDQIAFDAFSLAGFVAMLATWLLALDVEWSTSWWLVALGVIGASVLTDLGSGMVHWLWDTWGSQDWPIVGKTFIRPFREHHVDPKAITHHDFLETNGACAFTMLPFLAAAWWCAGHHGEASLFASVMLGSVSVLTLMTNQFHKWAHATNVPRSVALLQRLGLILTPDGHDLHHHAPFTAHYCITHGWLNPLLDRIRFFRALEHVITRLTGTQPRTEDLQLVARASTVGAVAVDEDDRAPVADRV
jgi:ubiquitin-conjugating enzyme E2 variant